MQTEGQVASPSRTGREEQLQFLRFWAFFNVFVVADSIAFNCSTASVVLQFFSSTESRYHIVLRFTIYFQPHLPTFPSLE